MSLASATCKVSYTGNGSVSTYSYTFKINNQSHLQLIVRDTGNVETILVLNTDYTVSGVGSSSGGAISLVNASQSWLSSGKLKSGYVLVIRRIVPLTQITDIRNQGDFYPEIHEDEFDLLTMADQQQQEDIDQSVKLAKTIPSSSFDPTLPTNIGTANALLKVNASGNGFETGPTTISIFASEAAAAASAAAAAASSTAAGISAAASAASASAANSSAVAAAASAASALAYVTPTITGNRLTPQNIVAASGIAFVGPAYENIWFIQGNAGPVNISSNPQIAAGTLVGQKLKLIGRDDTKTVQFNDGTGLSLKGICILGADQILDLFWDGTNWNEYSRSN